MSRYIATRAIRGANALVTEAEFMLNKALAEKGPEMRDLFGFLLEQEKNHEQRLQDEYDKAFRQEW